MKNKTTSEKLIRLSKLSNYIKKIEVIQEKRYGHSLLSITTIMQLIGSVERVLIGKTEFISASEYNSAKERINDFV